VFWVFFGSVAKEPMKNKKPILYFSFVPNSIKGGTSLGGKQDFRKFCDSLQPHVSIVPWALDDFWGIVRRCVRPHASRVMCAETADIFVVLLSSREGSFSQGYEVRTRLESAVGRDSMLFARSRDAGAPSKFLRTLMKDYKKKTYWYTSFGELYEPILSMIPQQHTDL